VLIGALTYGLLSPAPDRDRRTVPDFELELLNAPGRLTSEELRGSPVVINFFASWCIPCREEAPLLEAAWKKHRADGVRFVGVSIRDAASDARAFADDYGITYPLVHDPQEVFAGPIGVLGLPETYFVDEEWHFAGTSGTERIANRQGTVWFGPISAAELEEKIGNLLAGR
jgi:cytochrome c biogenesis protein CcmG/thiol:disulfide interchange protein DsbE